MPNIVLTVKSDDISIVLDEVAHNFDLKSLTEDGIIVSEVGLELVGEVLGLNGVLNSNAAYEVRRLEAEQGLPSSGDWGYYAKQLANMPAYWLKVWVRWNAQEDVYDYYLKADAYEVFSHAIPYLGTVREEE